MAIDFKTAIQIVPHVINTKKPIMFRGRHGVGKSEVVYQIASKIGLPVIERRVSQMTEGDLVGLPIIKDDSTTFNPPDWFKEACDHARLLFLDEVDRGTTEVSQQIFELTDSRKLNGHCLHPDTIIFAAVNGGEHGSQYQVRDMDPAELDRWTVFDVEPSEEDWLNWAKDQVDEVIWDFINQNRAHLEHSGDFEPNKVYPSRRSWKRLNDCLVQACLLQEGSKQLFHLANAFVGMEAAVSLNDFVTNYSRMVTVEDVLDKGRIDKTSDFDINEHTALVEKMESGKYFDKELTSSQLDNLAKYFISLPSEVTMKLWTALGKSEMDNAIKLHGTVVDGVKISDHLVSMLTGQ